MERVTNAKSSLRLRLKNKTSAVKTEVIILFLLSRDKKTLLAALNKRFHALLGRQPKLPPPPHDRQLYVDQNVSNSWTVANPGHTEVVKPEETAAVAEQVQEIDSRKEREEEEEEEAEAKEKEKEEEEEEVLGKKKEMRGLEEGIDKKAESFIERFHRQMRMQEQQSFQDERLFAPPQPL
ncbi:uncharacterized protein LOC127793491 [Diospyros lotus]|uniref:uncharacterized protein LOC127793491 n=1 Tax=Diospyros lotus TaxID=55363 RepID=UPI0022512CD1|nr:uncharacterized protein LOC127793491 [Diospyros lotus]